MLSLYKQVVLSASVAFVATISVVQAQEMLSEEELRKAYQEAAKEYAEEHPMQPEDYDAPLTSMPEMINGGLLAAPNMLPEDGGDVTIISDEAKRFHSDAHAADYLPLQVVRVAVDVENQTLKEVVSEIVGFAEKKSGPWKVKWRLRPENKHILEARVNLTAETTFEGFMNHLVDRINNMTGVQLGVSVFDMSRIIVISDIH